MSDPNDFDIISTYTQDEAIEDGFLGEYTSPFYQMQPGRGIFPLGRIFCTPGALALGLDLPGFILRHSKGDGGDLAPEDKQANVDALRDGCRVFSSYKTPAGPVWIITEADRSSTTALLPSEY